MAIFSTWMKIIVRFKLWNTKMDESSIGVGKMYKDFA
jgi:hypothetical protein